MARTIAKDHDAKRGQILAAAARVFAEQGIARASMAQVAAACGISKANIYHYYGGKDALLFDILDSYLSALRDRVAAVQVPGQSPEVRLRAMVTETLLAYEGMDHEHKIQTEGIATLPPEQQDVLKGYQREMVTGLSAVVAALAPDLAEDRARLRATVMSVFGMLNWFYMWHPHATHEDREAYARTVCDLLLGGIRGGTR